MLAVFSVMKSSFYPKAPIVVSKFQDRKTVSLLSDA